LLLGLGLPLASGPFACCLLPLALCLHRISKARIASARPDAHQQGPQRNRQQSKCIRIKIKTIAFAFLTLRGPGVTSKGLILKIRKEKRKGKN